MSEPVPFMSSEWICRINAVIGSLIVTIGFWLLWGELSPLLATVIASVAAGFLVWRGSTLARVWAWATLLLGIESLVWPILTMMRVRMAGGEPTEQQMEEILTAVLFGLFSAVFWTSFAYGIFQRIKRQEAPATPERQGTKEKNRHKSGKKKR